MTITAEQLIPMLAKAFIQIQEDVFIPTPKGDDVSLEDLAEKLAAILWDLAEELAAILSEKLAEQSDNYPDELVERIKWAAAQPGKQYTSEEMKEWLDNISQSSNKPDNEG